MRMRQHIIALMVLACAMLLSSYPALAQFSQQGPKLEWLSCDMNEEGFNYAYQTENE